MRSRKFILILSLFFLLILPSMVSAFTQRINISLSEVVTRNVSYNRFFSDGEAVTTYTIRGTVNVTNVGNDTLFDIYVTFKNTNNLLNQSADTTVGPDTRNNTYFVWEAGRNGTDLNGTPPQYITLHIPELRANESTRFNYSVNTSLTEPLNIETDYNIQPDNNFYYNKVLAGENFTIKQNITNSLAVASDITNINITIDAQAINWNGSSLFANFTLLHVNQSHDWRNVSQYSNLTWSWTPYGGTLNSQNTSTIIFTIRAPDLVPSTATYLALQETLVYTTPATASNLTLINVIASSYLNLSFDKRISQPSTNVLDRNATWEIRPYVNTHLPIAYNLTRVTLWVTETINPNIYANDSIAGTRLLQNYTPNTQVNHSAGWSGSYWYFNFSDGTSGTPPPIVWMKPEFHIINDFGQILNYSITTNGTDIYLKYIYVISGYWLEVEKNITNTGPDNYTINISVFNRGNGHTPQNLTVSVYDVIPSGFLNTSSIYPNPNSIQTITGIYNGSALQWDIPQREPYNASLFARGDPNGYDRWYAAYNVSGIGDYNVLDLYIVGLDPRQVDGAFSSPLISVIGGIQSYSKEILYFSIVLFLIVLNTTNLFISSKIHKKLEGQHDLNMLRHDIEDLKSKIRSKK